MRPEVTVVISTRLRETRLAFALEALAQQTLAVERFEVIVVRSGDSVDVPLSPPPDGLNLKPLVCLEGGTAVKRNLGWRAAGAELIAFTDDDCRPSPGWLEALVAARGSSDLILQGRTEPDPDEAHLLHGLARSIRITEPPSWYETCNIAYPRALLEALGGFDEDYEFFGDDTDLGCRAQDRGAGLRFVGDAVVWHAVHWRSLRAALNDARKASPLPSLIKRHPRQRSQLQLGVFSFLEHLYLLIGIGGLLVGRRSKMVAVLSVGPYLHRRVDRARLTPWGLLRLPSQLAARVLVDGAQLTTLLVSSMRHRTLAL